MMMKLGSTTPACQGSKNTSISCNPRKYHGAFDGFGVRVGLAGSSRGASTSRDQMTRRSVTKIAHRNSARTKCGQVYTLSSLGPVAFAGAADPAAAAVFAPASAIVYSSDRGFAA